MATGQQGGNPLATFRHDERNGTDARSNEGLRPSVLANNADKGEANRFSGPRQDSGNDEPPSKRQRADTEEKPPVASRPSNPASFPADTLFRCQRVVELLLRHPHITYFNQALGQPNITTIDGCLRDLPNAPDDVKSPANLFALLRRVFVSFDRACPAEHPLKRVGQALEQHFMACWKQAGLESFCGSPLMPNTQSTRPASDAPQAQQPQSQGSGPLQQAGPGSKASMQEQWAARMQQSGQQRQQQPQIEPSNSPIIALPERAAAPQQVARTQPWVPNPSSQQAGVPTSMQGLSQMQARQAQPPQHMQLSGSRPGGSLDSRGPPTGSGRPLISVPGGFGANLAGQRGPGDSARQVVSTAQQLTQGPGNTGRTQLSSAQKAAELQRLKADAEIKPHERLVMEQVLELRRRRSMAEAAIQQAQAAFQRYKLCEQEVHRLRTLLAQEKMKSKSTEPPNSEAANPTQIPSQQNPVDANCLLSANEGAQKLSLP